MSGGGGHSILLWLNDTIMYVYGACLFLCLLQGLCGNVCCAAAVVWLLFFLVGRFYYEKSTKTLYKNMYMTS